MNFSSLPDRTLVTPLQYDTVGERLRYHWDVYLDTHPLAHRRIHILHLLTIGRFTMGRSTHVTAKVTPTVKAQLELERKALGLSMSKYLSQIIDDRKRPAK